MRIKIVNVPNLSGYVWVEVLAGVSFVASMGLLAYPF